MKAHDRILTLLLLVMPLVMMWMEHPLSAQDLSLEGVQQQEIHDYLFGSFLAGRAAIFQETAIGRALKEITVFEGGVEERRVKVQDRMTIQLADGTERVAGLFRHLAIRGTNLDQIREVRVLPFSPDHAPPRSAQATDFYRVQMPTIPAQADRAESMSILVLMKPEQTCQINEVIFVAQTAISEHFDDLPFRDLGAELPRERVPVQVDLDHELVIGASSDLDRSRWFRTQEVPGLVDMTFQRWAVERGFLPGRGIFKFHPALTRQPSRAESLQQREDQPGAADLSFFDRYDAGSRLRNTIPEYRHHPFCMCFNDWPPFMAVPQEGRGTPLIEHFDDAADLAAAYIGDQLRDAGGTAAWWEVKNESSFRSEWAYHWREKQGIDGWGLLADFHNRVADAIHATAPNVKVGGPAAAYLQLQQKDFSLFQDQARFIEETRGHIDFFSYHFYENAGSFGPYARRGSGYSNFLLGKYEAVLDMLRAQMHKVDHVLPILVTECGSLQNGRKPSDNWLRLYAWNAYLTKSMQRPDQIDLFVPFLFLHMPWNPTSGDAAFMPKPDRAQHRVLSDFEPTPIAHFFEFWRDFDGRRLPVQVKRPWLDVVAVHRDREIMLAVTNLGGRQLQLDLSGVAAEFAGVETLQRRLNYHRGEVVFQPDRTVDPAAVPVDVNETTLIKIVLPTPLKPVGTLRQERWYATETAVMPEGRPGIFVVRVEQPDDIHSAKCVLGFHRRGGLTDSLTATVNGTPVRFDLSKMADFDEFFAPLEATVPASAIRAENEIILHTQQGTTVTSVQLCTRRSGD